MERSGENFWESVFSLGTEPGPVDFDNKHFYLFWLSKRESHLDRPGGPRVSLFACLFL